MHSGAINLPRTAYKWCTTCRSGQVWPIGGDAECDGAREEAVGGKRVTVHGACTAQRALEAGVLDELQIHQLPVLFGNGRGLVDVLPSSIELDILRVVDTHIRYQVRH
ncbi:dihydrofolate reductase family protein [Kribbella qitaiheensis]|uniref:dihydrofolate reductase family protein n=1 Tax=Kribbella qitaiheensis TaxID=1544730 RepID=UPI00248449FF|nr:dihydrofolate reductase family protein [Kribbella qitaiheensis]